MKKSRLITTITFLIFLLIISIKPTSAATVINSCLGKYGIDFIGQQPLKEFISGDVDEISFRAGNFPAGDYKLKITDRGDITLYDVGGFSVAADGPAEISTSEPEAITSSPFNNKYLLISGPLDGGRDRMCAIWHYVVKDEPSSCEFEVSQDGYDNPGCLEMNKDSINVKVNNLKVNGELKTGIYRLFFSHVNKLAYAPGGLITINNGEGENTFAINTGGTYRIGIGSMSEGSSNMLCQSRVNLVAKNICTEDERKPVNLNDLPDAPPFEICNAVTSGEVKAKCIACLGGDSGSPIGIYTAIGCIPTDIQGITTSIFKLAIGLSGGAVLLFILYGSFLIVTSSGNPENVVKGKEVIVSAVIGLLFIIFAVVILNIIGVEILKIPGL